MPQPLCSGCVHLRSAGTCTAFPDGIPVAISNGGDHRARIGDEAVAFAPLGAFGAQVLAEWEAAQPALVAALEDAAPPGDGPSPADRETPEPTTPPEQWHAVWVVSGNLEGGDPPRMIAPGALRHSDTPLPLMWTPDEQPEPHGGAIQVGAGTRVEVRPRTDGVAGEAMHVWGHWLPEPAAELCRERVRLGSLRGVSIDADDPTVEVQTEEVAEGDMVWEEPVLVTWTDLRVRGATVTPFPAYPEAFIEDLEQQAEALVAAAAVADAIPVAPPAAWFDNPALDGPTPLTVTDEGRIFGHLAAWGTCHVGVQGACVTPPHSPSGYSWFRTGEVLTAEGARVAVGQITMDTGHADLALAARPAAVHYDDTGSAVADVSAGEDDHGIWLAGAVRPGTTAEAIRSLRASKPSGDWRAIGGALDLVAALAVNVPGFPVPRVRVASAQPVALTAAGPVRPRAVSGASLDRVAELLGERIGRDRPALVAALDARVHG